MRLQNKVIVVIGGTTGMGLSAATAFVREGANVVVVGRNAESANTAVASLGQTARAFAGDATEPNTAKNAIALALNTFGKFDGLYHVAGGSGRKHGDGPLHEITDDGWEFTLNLNLTSLFYSNRAAVQEFLRQGRGGTILNIGSILSYSPSPHFFATHAYAAAKAAVLGFTRSAASDHAHQNIRCNVIVPALVETPMSQRALGNAEIMEFISTKQPLDNGRTGLPTDLDGAAILFMSDESRFITGQVLAVDGGWSVSEGQIPAA